MTDIQKNAPLEGCWNSIGVWGSEIPRCPRLDEVIHCHNCEVFHTASLVAYERAIPGDYRDEWSEVLAGSKEMAVRDAKAVIVFRINEEWVALAAGMCKEISRMLQVHRLPHNKSQILKGVVNNGGEIRICFSLGNLLGIARSSQPYGEEVQTVYARMIVIEAAGRLYVFAVSEIKGMYYYRESELAPLPNTALASSASYMRGVIKWEGKNIGCLDEALLTSQLERSVR